MYVACAGQYIRRTVYFEVYSKCRSGRAQHAAPNKKGNVGRRKTEGGAGRQSVVPAARLGTHASRLVAG
jgi:hypothetical protein